MRMFDIIEEILRNRHHFFIEIRDKKEIGPKIRGMALASIAFLIVYGAVLGASHSLLQSLSSAIKLPVLFFATLLITAPTLYFFHVLFGSSQNITQSVALILTAITVTSVLLLALAPVTLFFLVTTGNYAFFKLLNVAIFAIAGIRGVVFLSEGLSIVSNNTEGAARRRNIVRLWIVLYALVGTQMVWTLRPFVGAPTMEFELFRNIGGNFYTNVMASIGEVLGFWVVR